MKLNLRTLINEKNFNNNLFPTLEVYSEETKQLISLEQRYDNLIKLKVSLESKKFLTQSVALEADRILPNNDILSRFQSTKNHKQKYNYALEELSKGVMALIIAGIAAVIAFIIKAIGWFGGGGSSSSGGSDSGSGSSFTPETIKKHKKDMNEIIDIVKHPNTIDKNINVPIDQEIEKLRKQTKPATYEEGKEFVNKHYAERKEENRKRLISLYETFDDIENDIFHNGPVTQAIHNLSLAILNENIDVDVVKFTDAIAVWYKKFYDQAKELDKEADKANEYLSPTDEFKQEIKATWDKEIVPLEKAITSVVDKLRNYHKVASSISSDKKVNSDLVLLFGSVRHAVDFTQAEAVASKKTSFLESHNKIRAQLEDILVSLEDAPVRNETDSEGRYPNRHCRLVFSSAWEKIKYLKWGRM